MSIFYIRVPDTATVRNKMLYASSKLTLTKELLGIPVMINATCKSDLSASILRERNVAENLLKENSS